MRTRKLLLIHIIPLLVLVTNCYIPREIVNSEKPETIDSPDFIKQRIKEKDWIKIKSGGVEYNGLIVKSVNDSSLVVKGWNQKGQRRKYYFDFEEIESLTLYDPDHIQTTGILVVLSIVLLYMASSPNI